MKKKRILSLALVVALLVSNPAIVLADDPPQVTSSIGGVTVTGNSSAYVASGSASTYMATYCPMVSVDVYTEYKGYDMETGADIYMSPWRQGMSSVLVIANPNNEYCVTEYMKAIHHASDGIHAPWEGSTSASYL